MLDFGDPMLNFIIDSYSGNDFFVTVSLSLFPASANPCTLFFLADGGFLPNIFYIFSLGFCSKHNVRQLLGCSGPLFKFAAFNKMLYGRSSDFALRIMNYDLLWRLSERKNIFLFILRFGGIKSYFKCI
jgi:hypothetical protein